MYYVHILIHIRCVIRWWLPVRANISSMALRSFSSTSGKAIPFFLNTK